MTDYLFVYGTLKRGYCRSFLLKEADFLGEAETLPGFRLFDCGEYPGMVHSPHGQGIRGELYRILPALLPALDECEGVAEGLYLRETVPLRPPHDQLLVWSYIYNQPTRHLLDCGRAWPDGDVS